MGGPRGDRADGSHPAAGVPSGLAWGAPGAASRAIHSTFITSIGRGAALSPSSFIGRRLSEALSRRRWRPTRCRHSGLTRYARSICARSARRSANAFGSCWTGQLRSRRPDWSLCFDASSNRNRKSRRQSRQPLKSLRQLSSYGGQIANPPYLLCSSSQRTRRANHAVVLHVPLLFSAQKRFKKSLREKTNFVKPIKMVAAFKISPQKYSSFAFTEFAVCFPHSAPNKGRTRRHERGAECGGRECAFKTYGMFADSEVVWSWRAYAGAQVRAKLQRLRTGDGGKRWFTEEHV